MRKAIFLLAGVAFLAAACDEAPTEMTAPETAADAPAFKKAGGSDVEAQMSAMLDEINVALEAEGVDYRAVMVEWVTGGPDADEAGAVTLQKDIGNKQLGFDFVPNDDRRPWSADGGNAITYAIDQTGDAVPPGGGLTGAETDAAIVRGHDTWEAVNCAALGQSRNSDFGLDIGVVAFDISGGVVGSPFVFADVQHAGWRDLNFGGGVLGATFTFGFTGGTCGGIFTDVDGNGKCDTAFREVYYDPSWLWTSDGSGIDVETVALHETGHGLSQGHFGNIQFKNDGSLSASPRAVMNAFIFGVDRVLYGTDNGGHCSNWAEWPNN